MAKKNYIEINGKHYDANTGLLIERSEQATSAKNSKAGESVKVSVKSSKKSESTPQKSKAQKAEAKTESKSEAKKSSPAQPEHKASKARSTKTSRTKFNKTPAKTQRSKTLMRKSVAKPTAKSSSGEAVEVKIKKSDLGTKPQRAKAAKATAKSEKVQKYSPIKKTVHENIAVQTPKQHSVHAATKAPGTNNQHSSSASNQKLKTTSQALIENALNNAQSHLYHLMPEHVPEPRTIHHKIGISKKLTSAASFGMAALLLGGFFAVQNVPNLSMRVASSRSGIESASLPDYTPSGFSFKGPIDYSEGRIQVSFRSNTDERSYTLTEEETQWDSEQLRDEFLAANANDYDTFLNGKGQLLYVYGDSNATWVKDGVWYRVEGESQLTSDQLAQIASSI